MIFELCFAQMWLLHHIASMSTDVLIIDDDRTEQRLVRVVLSENLQLGAVCTDNGREALKVLKRRGDIALVIVDLDMPVMSGHDVLEELRKHYRHIPAIVLTGSRDLQDAVRAMKNGACDFLAKPVNRNSLIIAVRNALKLSVAANAVGSGEVSGCSGFSDLLGHDGGLEPCVGLGKKAAAAHFSILIQGETGTGKEMFARAIHGESQRASKPFIAVNCGAIPEKLIESTLFGHEKGAFTGAINKTIGKFREAHGGTLFLDEIGELPPEAQVKMLRALQQQEIEPVGAAKPVQVDVRIISATHCRLEEEIAHKRFREDLYFRLNVLQIFLPPLRMRIGDIVGLAQHFAGKAAKDHSCALKTLSDEAVSLLKGHYWPGNVRELENVIYRAVALSDGDVIKARDIVFADYSVEHSDHHADGMLHVSIFDKDGALRPLKDIESDAIQKALKHCNQNMTQTARALGIAKSTLYAKTDNG